MKKLQSFEEFVNESNQLNEAKEPTSAKELDKLLGKYIAYKELYNYYVDMNTGINMSYQVADGIPVEIYIRFVDPNEDINEVTMSIFVGDDTRNFVALEGLKKVEKFLKDEQIEAMRMTEYAPEVDTILKKYKFEKRKQ